MLRSIPKRMFTSVLLTLVLGGAAVAVNLFVAADVWAANINVNSAIPHQTMTGFGTCMPAWISSLGRNPQVHQAYWQDLGCSIFRTDMTPAALNQDVCNETNTYMGPNIDENIALFNFNINSKLAPDPYGPMAAAANTLAIDDFIILGTIWSPPNYMKTGATCKNNESCGGSLITTPENLTQFGRYCAAYIKGWSQYWGVPVTYFSPQNEPGVGTNRYGSCFQGPSALPLAVNAVRTELDANGMQCKLLGIDGPWYISSWDHIQDLFGWVDGFRNYGLADLDGYATHFNTAWGDARRGWDVVWNGGIDPQHTDRSFIGIKNDGLQHNWMTEISGEQDSWAGATELAKGIHHALATGHVDAYIYWLFTMGGSNSQALCELIDGVPNTSAPKYAAFKHYSRYIRPGAVRIDATPAQSGDLYVTAYEHPVNNTVTVVAGNWASTAQTVNLSLFTSVNVTSFNAFRSSASERWASVGPYPVSGGSVSFTIPAGSLVTLYSGSVGGGGGCTATATHVDALTATVTGNGPNKRGQATITIKDNCGIPVANATVTGDFTGTFNESGRTGVTNSSGVATITTNAKSGGTPSVTFCVTNITHASLSYDSAANVATCDSN